MICSCLLAIVLQTAPMAQPVLQSDFQGPILVEAYNPPKRGGPNDSKGSGTR